MATLAPRHRVPFRFDGDNPDAQRAAAKRAADFVVGISRSQREAVRAIILRSIRDGIPPLDAARLIRDVVGLDPRRANAVANYREELVRQGSANVSGLVDRYAERQLRNRAETIARTEILEALNAGALESWRQARADGYLTGDAEKEWIVTPDDLLCPICEPLDGERRPVEVPFSGGVMMPPQHANCRCAAAPVEPRPE